MDDTATRFDQIEEGIFSDEISDEALETAAAASSFTTEWCAATSRCTAPAVTSLLTKSARRDIH